MAALWRKFIGAFAAVSLGVVASSVPASQPESFQDGRRLFSVNCAPCHGERGDGKGEAAARLKTAPRDLTAGVYKFRSTGSSQPPTDDDLKRTISLGIPGTGMVAQGDLGEAKIRSLVDFVKTLSSRFAKNPNPRSLPIPPAPAKDKTTLAAGRKIYEESGCIECHGARARGDGPSSSKLSIRPADLTLRPFKSGAGAKDIVRTILTGLDGTSMPSYHQVLPEEKIWLLAYYVESLGKAPVVTEDERFGRELLRQIRALAERR